MNTNLFLSRVTIKSEDYDKFSKLMISGTFNDYNKDQLMATYYEAEKLLKIFDMYHEPARPVELLLALGYYDDMMYDYKLDPVRHLDRDIAAHVSKSINNPYYNGILPEIDNYVFTRGFDRRTFVKYFDIYLAGIRSITEKDNKKGNEKDAITMMSEV